ncbi:MAG: CoA transferase [Dehalococcoidia bacterium]
MQHTPLLAGVRVLDFTRIIAGPHATRTLADFGADVIKVEEPHEGDHTRSEIAWGRNTRFIGYNYGKRSIAIDLKAPAGRDVALKLAAVSDVVVENFRPGVMRRLGLDYDALRAINPRIIFCSISGFGHASPAAERPLHAGMAHAISGIIHMDEREPRQLPASLGDPIAAIHAVAGICAALYAREKTGHGQFIDIALLDVVFSMMGPQAEFRSVQGGAQRQIIGQERSTSTVPTGMFKGRDGWIVLGGGVEQPQWFRLANVIGRPDLARMPHTQRRAQAAMIYGLIDEWIMSVPTVAEAERILAEGGVVAGKVQTPEEALKDPLVRERGLVVPMDDPITGPFEATAVPFHFSDAPVEIQGLPPGLGEHTREVLSRVLGYDDAAIQQLYDEGVVFTEPVPDEIARSAAR